MINGTLSKVDVWDYVMRAIYEHRKADLFDRRPLAMKMCPVLSNQLLNDRRSLCSTTYLRPESRLRFEGVEIFIDPRHLIPTVLTANGDEEWL